MIGEMRYRFGEKEACILGFFVCMFFFVVTWFKAGMLVMFLVSIIGATGALIGETKKFLLVDDDFMIQMLPAVFLLLLWLGMKSAGVDILPEVIIHPGLMHW